MLHARRLLRRIPRGVALAWLTRYMAIRVFDVGPAKGLRRAAASDLPNLVGIAGPNGAGKSNLLEQLRIRRNEFIEPGTDVLFVGAHRTWRSGVVSEVAVLGFTYGFEDVLKLDAIPGFQYQPPGGLHWLGGLNRLSSSADDAQALVKTALIRIYHKQRDLVTKQYALQGRRIGEGTVPDLFEPFSDMVRTLLPHLEWLGVDPQNTSDVRCLFRASRGDGPTFDIDELSSGEKAAIALFLPFVEREARVLAGEVAAQSDGIVGLTVIIDEPEIHLHPLLQLNVLDYLRRLAHQSRAQFIFTTHSPTLLDALEEQELFLLSPASVSGDNQLSRLSASQERLEMARAITGSTQVLTRCRPVVVIEGEPDAGPTASDQRLLRLLCPQIAHWALIPMAGKTQVVRAATGMRSAALHMPATPVFGIVDADVSNVDIPDFVITWPVAMIENLLLDPAALWQVAAPYMSVTGLASASAVENALREIAFARQADEVRLRVREELPQVHIALGDLPPDVSIEQAACDRAAEFGSQFSADARRAASEAAERFVAEALETGSYLERFHGKRLLRDFYGRYSFGSAGFSWNAFVTECARAASAGDRVRALTDPTIERIRLYFPPGVAEFLEEVEGLVPAGEVATRCRQHRLAWEGGQTPPGDPELLRQHVFGVGRALADGGHRESAEHLFALAAEIGVQ
ncbi:AAA family ATPase [Acidimicrobiaceae bacterium USS-CC1]|uniref:AAA family ATPase n=1 Tax=Acidiferrimicrobium australe TaxID=2664430 RepID=A0ABW9QNI1_9ACTN|nr:AAA family ATPase [Acidiferrimicrobium australe]